MEKVEECVKDVWEKTNKQLKTILCTPSLAPLEGSFQPDQDDSVPSPDENKGQMSPDSVTP